LISFLFVRSCLASLTLNVKLFPMGKHLYKRSETTRKLTLNGGRLMNAFGKGFVVASAVATLLASGSLTAKADEKAGGEVACAGINSCKGQGSCAGEGHSCAGKNACKGQGWVKVKSEKDCTDQGGKVVKSE
jgi:uncharacterized membrane protein